MKYKMIASDLDDTLLTRDKKISEENIDAIKRAAEKGVIFVISTGRLYASAKKIADLLGVNSPIICTNGAIIVDDSGRVLTREKIEYDALSRIEDVAIKYDQYYYFYDKYNVYTKINTTKEKNYSHFFPHTKDSVKLINYENISELKSKNIPIYKSIFISLSDEILSKIQLELGKINDIAVTSSFRNNVEVNNKNVSKGIALEKLAEYYGIKREEVIAIGDNRNDISMIEYAGLGIAVNNAGDEIKNCADYVTVSNEESAISKVIKEFVI